MYQFLIIAYLFTLFAEARGGVFSFVNMGQCDNKGVTESKPERLEKNKPSGKPKIKGSICRKGHLIIRCYKTPVRNKYTARK